MASGQVEIADESFFQIVLMNSPFNSTVGYQRVHFLLLFSPTDIKGHPSHPPIP